MENAGKCLTFGRWDWPDGKGNAAVWCSGGDGASAHLWKVSGKCGKVPHLRKVGRGRVKYYEIKKAAGKAALNAGAVQH